jgi:YHS domain-containing protein
MKYKDPICGMEVEADTPYKSELNGETFYFCSKDCKEKFDSKNAK